MKFYITSTSGSAAEGIKEISNLEELMEVLDGGMLVLTAAGMKEKEYSEVRDIPTIEIYDDYR